MGLLDPPLSRKVNESGAYLSSPSDLDQDAVRFTNKDRVWHMSRDHFHHVRTLVKLSNHFLAGPCKRVQFFYNSFH